MKRECQREVNHKWGSLLTGEQPNSMEHVRVSLARRVDEEY